MPPSRWRQIEAIYNAAVERVPGERAAYIARACAGDAELRREVESLLAQESSTIGTLNWPASESEAGDGFGESTVTVFSAGCRKATEASHPELPGHIPGGLSATR
jgi:hypothetical protein